MVSAGVGGECLSRCSAVTVPGNGPYAAGAVGWPDLYRRPSTTRPARRNPGSFDRVGALAAGLRGCLGLPPVS